MKWFKNWFAKKCREAWEEAQNVQDSDVPMNAIGAKHARVRARDSFETDGGLNMQVYKANGGKIVSFNNYDNKTDRNYRTVYIITDEQDFERELGKMITMESMKL